VVTYTNKAASILRAKGIEDATTVYRIMYDLVDDVNMIWRKRRELPFDLVIVDESSMIGTTVRDDLESYGCPVLYVGDPFQLKPVKDEAWFLHPDYTLSEVMRHGDAILNVVTAIREGRKYPDVDQYDLTSAQIASYDAVICYTNRKRFELNRRIRKELGHSERPEAGDRVLMSKTDYDYGLFAGETGTVTSTNGKWKTAVLFDGETQSVNFTRTHWMQEGENPYDPDFAGRQCLDWAYALTCHKAQGSQYDRVLVWVERMADASWLYTAGSRAIKELLIGGY
jgi:exodeoxyribonuclease-5